MNNFHSYITPEQAAEFAKKNGNADRTVEFYRRAAKAVGKCSVCDEEAWRYGGLGMCFSCTTGESDASEDYELEPQ